MAKHSNLVIVESPSKAKTIGKYLGSDYRVEACMGHLRDLPKSVIGVDFERDFEPQYQPLENKDGIIDKLRNAAEQADFVYLATDPDREGEAISFAFFRDSLTAVLVISLKVIRYTFFSASFNASYKCQEIASPSRSGSVAR